jgi:hypothetical protein
MDIPMLCSGLKLGINAKKLYVKLVKTKFLVQI